MEFATDINNVMYAYIDRKKKFPVTTLLRSIGYETDKDILELFGMAVEVKADKKTLNANLGKRLAARVLRTWVEDFVDEDTGEVVSLERNEIVLERDTILDEDNIAMILELDVKILQTVRSKPFSISTASCVVQMLPTMKLHAVLLTNYSLVIKDMILVK